MLRADGAPGKDGVLLEDVADLARRRGGDRDAVDVHRPPAVGVTSPPIMLRMVDLPHPDGPTMATNSPSWISKDAPWTAAHLAAVVAEGLGQVPDRDARGALHADQDLYLACAFFTKLMSTALLVRDGLVERGGHPHLHAVLVVLLLDEEVPVEDRPVVAARSRSTTSR